MSRTYKSPYATSFKSAIKRGTSFHQAVWNIANRNNVNIFKVYESLFKADVVCRQKFNGQWLYWPVDHFKGNVTNQKHCQFNMWQWFVDWCLCNQHCTPEQLFDHKGSQKEFEAWCKKFWNKQFTGGRTTGATGRKRATTRSKSRTTTTGGRKSTTSSSSYNVSGRRSYSRAA